MSKGYLKRYTELPYLLYALRCRKLTLTNPNNWEDRNDAHYMMAYKKRKKLKSVLALCFTLAPETFHHWKVFSNGSAGVCIDFDRIKFQEWANGIPNLKYEDVNYFKQADMKGVEISVNELPFVKRFAFRDEREKRLVYESREVKSTFKNLSFDLSLIKRVVLSPWVPKQVAAEIEKTIQEIDGCENIRVFKTTLIENPMWKQRGNGD